MSRPLLLILLITSHGASIGTGFEPDSPPVGSTPSIVPDQSRTAWIDVDPFFIEPGATVSPHGFRALTRNILLDSKGDLWFATWQGIIRFDGEVFTNYTLKHDLRRFRVFSLLEDRKGNFWFGTIGGGVYRYDGQTFTNFTERDGLASDRVGSIFEDTAGNLWFATEKGASRYDGERFTNYTADDGLSEDDVTDVAQDGRGDLWFGTRGGLYRFDGRTFTELANPEGESFRNVRSLMIDRVGSLWIGSEDGLARYDSKSLTRVSTLYTGDVFEDRTGTLWVSAAVALLDRDPGGITALYRYDEAGLTLIATSGAVFGIEGDNAGNIWFGTLEGVWKYDGESITTFTEEAGSYSPAAAPDGWR